MKTFILRRKSGKETCNGIKDIINNDNVKIIRNQDIAKLASPPDILIRWGSTEPCPAKFEINTVEMIQLMNNKINCRRKLIEKEVLVPTTFFSKNEAAQGKFPLIGRQTFHSQGENIVICNNLAELNADNSSAYWSEVIKKDKEYRVFVFFGKILGVCEKIPKDKNKIAWNNSLGNGIFDTVGWKFFPKNVGLLALKACKELNIDLSAVDIIVKDETPYILELNSAPSCSEYRQKLFAKSISWLIKEIEKTGEKPKHFDYPEKYKKYADVLHPCLMNGEIEEDDNDFDEEEVVAAKQEIKQVKPVVQPVVKQNIEVKKQDVNNLQDEIHKLAGVSDLELRSVGNTLRIYGRVAGQLKHVKIMEIEQPNIKFWWED